MSGIIANVMWFGEGRPLVYCRALESFNQHHPDSVIHIYYNKKYFDLPSKFQEFYTTYKKAQEENSTNSNDLDYDSEDYIEETDYYNTAYNKTVVSEEDLLEIEENSLQQKIKFIDIANIKEFSDDPLLHWFDQFNPAPFAFISDYFRFLLLKNISSQKENRGKTIIYFELDNKFIGSLDKLQIKYCKPGSIIINNEIFDDKATITRTHHILIVKSPNENAIHLLENICWAYQQFLSRLLIKIPALAMTNERLGSVFDDILNDFEHKKLTAFSNEIIAQGYKKYFAKVEPERIINLDFLFSDVQGLASRIIIAADEQQLFSNILPCDFREMTLHACSGSYDFDFRQKPDWQAIPNQSKRKLLMSNSMEGMKEHLRRSCSQFRWMLNGEDTLLSETAEDILQSIKDDSRYQKLFNSAIYLYEEKKYLAIANMLNLTYAPNYQGMVSDYLTCKIFKLSREFDRQDPELLSQPLKKRRIV